MIDKLLEMTVCEDSFRWAIARSGNPHSTRIVKKNDRKCIERAIRLGNSPAGSGHDCYLKGITILVDWYCTQTVHRQLLRYSHVEVVSSMSLMHSQKDIINDDFLMQNVAPDTTEMLRSKLKEGKTIVYDIPMGVLLGVSFRISFMTAKTIYQQRKNHPLREWRDFCTALEDVPYFDILCLGKENMNAYT